ncbi:MAG: ABC transporter permease [Blastocatellia bacterium]
MLRSLPYKTPERLVAVWETQNGNERGPVSAPNFFDWREQGDVFDHLGAIAFQPFNITGSAEAERVQGSFVSASLFDVFGIAPALGRTFTPEEDKPGHGNVVVVSHNLWKQRLGSGPGVIGMPLTLNGKDLTIVGVMPAGFHMVKEGKPGTFVMDDSDVWVPASFIADLAPGLLERRNTHFLRVVASLKPGVSLQQAKSAMSVVANRLEKQYPDTNTGLGVDLVPLHEQLIGQTRPVLLILFGAVSLVLLIACANVANLLLTRALARQKEMAIRLAMGASRGRLIRQFLTESVVLSSIGGALGLLLAYWGISVLVSLSPGNIPRVQESGLDLSVLGFTLGVSILTGIVFGFAPALQGKTPWASACC